MELVEEKTTMNVNKQMQIVGDLRLAGNPDAQRIQETVNHLQELMNKLGICRIDVAINPWQKGPMKAQRKGPVISLN